MLTRRTRPLLAALLLCAAGPAWATGAGQTYGPVRSGETLWQIAGRAYPGAKLERDQTLLALLAANPDAVTPPCNVNGALRGPCCACRRSNGSPPWTRWMRGGPSPSRAGTGRPTAAVAAR